MATESRRRLDAWLQSADEVLAQTGHTPDGGVNQDDQPQLLGKLWGKLHKERDLELHLRAGWIFGTEFVQFLDFVPSTGKYENAVLIEHRLVGRLLKELSRLHRYAGGTAGSLR